MIRFNNDYSEGAHPSVLDRLVDTNMVQTPGYGEDEYCLMAADIIKVLCGTEDIDVHFLVGGTQTNLTLISAALRPHQCAVSAASGHISTHESGAIESTGHKVMELPSTDGKITAEAVRKVHLAPCQRRYPMSISLSQSLSTSQTLLSLVLFTVKRSFRS